MILPVYVYGSAVLRKKAQEVPLDQEGLQKLISDMWETMNHAEGVGLAAPQVGHPIRLFVVDGDSLSKDKPELKGFKRVMINPIILEEGKRQATHSEGCLSLPDIHVDIDRPDEIVVEYYDQTLTKQEERLTGFACRMVLHEHDHLEGIVFTDRASAIRKKMLASKLRSIANGKGSASYRTVLD